MQPVSDFTYLSTLLRCQLQWWLRYVQQLEPREDTAMPRLAGKLGHKLLQLHHSGQSWSDQLEPLYAASGLVAVGPWEHLTQGHFEVIMHNYAKTYPADADLRVVSMLEEPLVSPALNFGGIPDMLVEESDGELAIWDHKWTGSWLGNLEKRLELTPQLPLYCVLASESTGQPVRKAVLNMIHMGPGASNPKSKAERFNRKPYAFSEWQLEQAKLWISQVQEIADRCTSQPPRNADSHCSYCDFRELCLARSEAVRAAVQATNFKKREITGALLSGADMEEV